MFEGNVYFWRSGRPGREQLFVIPDLIRTNPYGTDLNGTVSVLARRAQTMDGLRNPVEYEIPTLGRDTHSWPSRRGHFCFAKSNPKHRAGRSRPQGLWPWGFPAMLARNGPVGNSACAIYRAGLRHSSLFPRCVLRFSARTNGTPGEITGAGCARRLPYWIPDRFASWMTRVL